MGNFMIFSTLWTNILLKITDSTWIQCVATTLRLWWFLIYSMLFFWGKPVYPKTFPSKTSSHLPAYPPRGAAGQHHGFSARSCRFVISSPGSNRSEPKSRPFFFFLIWGFPKMVVPNNHSFSYWKWSFWGVLGVPPFKETSISKSVKLRLWNFNFGGLEVGWKKHMSHEKTRGPLLSVKYWLFNRDLPDGLL